MIDISFTYTDLTRFVEDTVAVYIEMTRQAKDKHERERFTHQAEGAFDTWARLVYKPVSSLGEAAMELHRADAARMWQMLGRTWAVDLLTKAQNV
jgi:hypothetical protein